MIQPVQPLHMTLTLQGKCDICGKHRSKGNHQKCSKLRKSFNEALRAQQAAQ